MVAEHFAEGPGSRGRPNADKGQFYGNWFHTQLHSVPQSCTLQAGEVIAQKELRVVVFCMADQLG